MAISNYENIQINQNFLIKPLPGYINMLENFGIIKYKEIALPRIILDPFNSNNLEQLFYSHLENREINEIKTPSNNNNYYKKSILFNGKTINPIPPKDFVSIINDNIGNQNNLNMNKSLSNNYENINKIILNSIHLLSNDTYIQNKNNISFQTNLIEADKNSNLSCLTSSKNPFLQQDKNEKSSKLFFVTSIRKTKIEEKKKISKKRKRNENTIKRVHTATDYDNILRKIQVHFLSFIINFTNDVINTLFNDKRIPKFKNLDYEIKKTVNHKSVEMLKSKDIGEILQLKISPKIKLYDGSFNKDIYDTIYKKYPAIQAYMNKSYISLFKEYYNNKNKIFKVNGQLIYLSPKTKIFNDLLIKNIKYKEKMKYVAINYFLHCYKRIKKPKFKTRITKKQYNFYMCKNIICQKNIFFISSNIISIINQ